MSTKWRFGSLRLRLFLLTSIFALLGISLIAVLLSEHYRVNAERRFNELLTAHLYNLMGSVEIDERGRLVTPPELHDPRFSRFASGWYWQVGEVGEPANRIGSPSLADATIPQPAEPPFDERFQRQYSFTDSAGQLVNVVEAQVYLGEGDDIYSFLVAGDRGELAEEIDAFTGRLILLLAVFAIGFVSATYGIVSFGLQPIAGATQRLAAIREGSAQKLEGEFPREIQPLIDETNALIESNRNVVHRARTQVGNLAHSLKTPIAVIQNEAQRLEPALRDLLLEQTSLMKGRVDSYLARARIAASHATVTGRTPADPVVERVLRVIGRLNPDLRIDLEKPPGPAPVFAGEEQDLEEILGNLLENAARFAESRIIARLELLRESRPLLRITIEDDGKGMNAVERQRALRRGERIDESGPGSGLGLAIVNDIVGEYQGSLKLTGSNWAGYASA